MPCGPISGGACSTAMGFAGEFRSEAAVTRGTPWPIRRGKNVPAASEPRARSEWLLHGRPKGQPNTRLRCDYRARQRAPLGSRFEDCLLQRPRSRDGLRWPVTSALRVETNGRVRPIPDVECCLLLSRSRRRRGSRCSPLRANAPWRACTRRGWWCGRGRPVRRHRG